MEQYKIRTEVFEGPMALLMHLIDKNQLDIYDIPIALITEQYIDYLRALEKFNIEIASEFLVMAATLLQIKSRMLLPKVPKTALEEEELLDPRQELVDRILEYKKYKHAASLLAGMADVRSRYYTRQRLEFSKDIPLPEGVTVDDLVLAFMTVWESQAGEADFSLVTREEVTIQDKMYDIVNLLRNNRARLTFSETLIRSGGKSEMIVSFLALLELIRLRRVGIIQQTNFGTIYITLRE